MKFTSYCKWAVSPVWALALALPAAAQIATVDATNVEEIEFAYDEDPNLHAPEIPDEPTVIYPSGTATGTITEPITDEAPVVTTSEPDTYTLSRASVYYTPPTEPAGPHQSLGASLNFDFGPGPVADDHIQVLESTAYGPETGYGWGDTSKVRQRDRGGEDPRARDFCLPAGTPFYVDLPNGHYRVSVLVGDAIGKSRLAVRAEGLLQLYSIGAPAGQYEEDSFPITLHDRRLTIEFFGGICHVNAITIKRVPDDHPHQTTIFLAGDSTVSNYRQPNALMGWGQPLGLFFDDEHVVVDNQAKGGRSSKSFFEEGSLATIENRMREGDYLFVMFAINDSADDNSNRKTKPESTFKAYLRLYVDSARERGATPVFVTSQTKCTYDPWGRFTNSVQGYPQAMRELGEELDVPVIDLNWMSIDYFTAIGVPAARACFVTRPDGSFDYIHLSPTGAPQLAALVAHAVRELNLDGLAEHVLDEPRSPDGE
ncbi:MAG TPA: GDSL-type esterase/lipase family protein [Tepidisphaeraceae bacterium]|nr:GDSL-type esterase/lipase family protein [Tepidisphaeraceae bacterium]